MIRARNFQELCVSVLHYYSSNPARTTSLPDTQTTDFLLHGLFYYLFARAQPPSSFFTHTHTHTHRTHPSYPQQTHLLLSQIGRSGTLPASVTASPLTTHWPLQSKYLLIFLLILLLFISTTTTISALCLSSVHAGGDSFHNRNNNNTPRRCLDYMKQAWLLRARLPTTYPSLRVDQVSFIIFS